MIGQGGLRAPWHRSLFSLFFCFWPTSGNLPCVKICFPHYFGITRWYMQKKKLEIFIFYDQCSVTAAGPPLVPGVLILDPITVLELWGESCVMRKCEYENNLPVIDDYLIFLQLKLHLTVKHKYCLFYQFLTDSLDEIPNLKTYYKDWYWI